MEPVMLGLVLVALAVAAHLFNRRLKWTAAVDRIPGPPAIPVLGNSWDLLWTYKFSEYSPRLQGPGQASVSRFN